MWETIQSFLTSSAGAIIGVLGGITLLWKYGSPVWAFKDRIEEHMKQQTANRAVVQTKLDDIFLRLADVESEVKYNGESSMKDMLARVDVKLDFMMDEDAQSYFICDHEGKNVYVNRTYPKMLGLLREELMEFNWIEYVKGYDAYKAVYSTAMESGREFRAKIVFFDISGKELPAEVKLRPTEKGNYMGIVTFQKQPDNQKKME